MRYSDHVVFSVSIDLPSNSEGDVSFHSEANYYYYIDWGSLFDNFKDIPW